MKERHETSILNLLDDRLFEALIQTSFDVYEIVDEHGVCVYASPSIESVFGYTPEEFVGRLVSDVVHPDQLEWARSTHERILREDVREPIYVTCRHKDGTWREVECVVENRVGDPAIGGIVVNFRDVTERRRWERALMESEERYQKAFHSSPDSIALSRLRDGVFLDVNESFERMTGHTREEMIGQSTLALDHWKDPADRDRLAAAVRVRGSVQGFEARFLDKSGHEHVGQLSAEIIEIGGEPCMLATARDVSDEVFARQELERTTERLRSEQQQLVDKNTALRQVLDHLQEGKNSYRHDLTSRVENLLRPFITKLRKEDGRLSQGELSALAQRLSLIVSHDAAAFHDNLAKLSPRERDVCDLIRSGMATREIAQKLALSTETVNKHRQSIRRKLQIDHRGLNLSSFLRSS